MSYEIWLKQEESKQACYAGTTTDHKRGSCPAAQVETLLSFLVQNEGNSIIVTEGHEASQLICSQGFKEFRLK